MSQTLGGGGLQDGEAMVTPLVSCGASTDKYFSATPTREEETLGEADRRRRHCGFLFFLLA